MNPTVLDELERQTRARGQLPLPPERRAIREQAGVTQDAVGRAVGVHRETVSRWEAGKRRPRGDLLVSYLELLDRLRAASQ